MSKFLIILFFSAIAFLSIDHFLLHNGELGAEQLFLKKTSSGQLTLSQDKLQWTNPQRPIKIMAIGDSLTEGGGVSLRRQQSYRGHLYNKLIQAGYQVDFIGPWHRETHAGGDSDHASRAGASIGPDKRFRNLTKLVPQLLQYDPDIILLMIGTNDIAGWSKKDGILPQDAAFKFQTFFETLYQAESNTIYFISSVPKNLYGDYRGKKVFQGHLALNATIKSLADQYPNVFFVDNYSLNFVDSDFQDWLHFSDEGAKKIADNWFKVIDQVLN